ncbi:MAG: cellulase family glycosylhydrolase [Lachnospiraceae bacterium]|nr:cellulase family glycosylhydrolase [Lachnospiraceae bacterium]
MRKRIISLLASTVLVLSLLSGCGNADTETENTIESTQQETTPATSEATTPSTDAETPVTPEGTTPDAPVADAGEGPQNAIEMAHLMGNGINLGNTMEAYGRSSVGVGAETSVYETFWGCPVTTPEMIQGMKDAGFDSLRIPVAWTNAMNYETGDYTIGEDYLARVEEIINYALDADMYVIVNDHWDGGWWGMFGSADEATRQAAMDLYVSMWTQIATRYEKYSDKLIFESGNEELGFRLNDTDVAADSGTLSDEDCYVVTNQINQAFVDTIRATGGNNAERFLLIAGFGTDITNTCNDAFRMPTDTVADRLLLSVHYYDPSGYCLWNSQENWGSKTEYAYMQEKLSMMQKFTEQGYGIIIGEYGVLEQQNGLRPDTVKYTESFLDLCDLYGYCPVLWDTNTTFSRMQGKIIFDEVAQMYLDHSFANQSTKTIEEIQTAAQADFEAAMAEAPEAAGVDDATAVAWIMYTSSDWGIQYSVGDVYAPDSKTAGIVATDVEITGEGTYTVALDFTGTSGGYASGVTFSAIGIANGEILYPGYCIEIKEVLINGEPYTLTGRPYTSSDDQKCTRLNLYNAWVTEAPDTARTAAGNAMYVTPCVLDAETLGNVETIEITFDYVPGK